MAMQYPREFIPSRDVPRAAVAAYQHLVDTYASESNKVGSVWSEIRDDQLEFRPHPRSSSIREILIHQILSERRFFAEFLGFQEPDPEDLLPPGQSPGAREYRDRVLSLARPRLQPLAGADESFWLTQVPFFDVQRQRIWVFWRRILHTAHHRAQIGVYLRLLEEPVPATYGPTADVTWSGADPTTTLDAARRRQP
jgi:uncharacterized damage-inducible protein DinB